MRHDLNDACSWVTQDTIALLIVAKAENTTTNDLITAAVEYNVPYNTVTESCICDDSTDKFFQTSTASSEFIEKVAFDVLKQEFLDYVLILHENGTTAMGSNLSTMLNSLGIKVSHLDVTDDKEFLKKVRRYFDPWNLTSLSDAGRRIVALNIGPVTDTFFKNLVGSTMQGTRTKILIVDSPQKWKSRLALVTEYEVDLIVISQEQMRLENCPIAMEAFPHEFHKISRDSCSPLSLERQKNGEVILQNILRGLDQCCVEPAHDEYIVWKSFPYDKGIQTLLPIGMWSSSCGLMKLDMMDVASIVYRIAVLSYPPFIVINGTTQDEITLGGCVFMEILQFLERKLNFKYKLVQPVTKEFGYRTITGKWTGAIGMILRGGADLIPFLTTTPSRMKVVDFTSPVATVYYGMLVATPSEPPRTFIFLRPYAKETWLLLIMVALLISITLYQMHVYSLKICGEYKGKKGLAKYSNCLWCVFSSMVQQSGTHLPVKISARLVLSTWWLAILVIVSTYSANLIAFLAFPEAKWVVQTLEDLSVHRSTILMIDEGCPIIEDFMESEVEVIRKIREVYFNNPSRGIFIDASEIDVADVVSGGRVIYIDDVSHLTRLIEKDYQKTGNCRVTIAPDRFSRMVTAVGFRRGSSLLPIIDSELEKIIESGVIDHWKAQYSPQRDECLDVKIAIHGEFEEVKYDDVQGIFHLLILGLAASIISLALEVIYQRIKHFKEFYYKPLLQK